MTSSARIICLREKRDIEPCPITSGVSRKSPGRAFHTLPALSDVHQHAPPLQPPKAPSALPRRRKVPGTPPISYAVFCSKKKKPEPNHAHHLGETIAARANCHHY